MKNNVVTRFAPSPTGFLHVGTVRTAIFAWLFARKHQGTFILRIEDTDKAREKEGALEHIIESLRWLGVIYDEGPDIGGPSAPYIQSQRLDTYKKYAQVLLEKGFAYPCPHSPEDLESFKKKAEQEKRPFVAREHRPATFGVWDGSQPVRFKVPEIKRYAWHDLSRGELSAGEEALDDIILIKSDGYPTYNFAHIIDDLLMGVTHVIRGQEFISSMPNYLAIYEALGITPPIFATMPEILGADGKKKLSKREGAKDILSYRTEGFLPDAMFNFLTLLGWHPEEGSEVLTREELIAQFSLERVQKGGAKFDEQKLLWLNKEKIMGLSAMDFQNHLITFAREERGVDLDHTLLAVVAPDLQTRVSTQSEALDHLQRGEYQYLTGDAAVTPELLEKGAKTTDRTRIKTHLHAVSAILADLVTHGGESKKGIQEKIMTYTDEATYSTETNKPNRAEVLWPLRVALTGLEKSPDPFTVVEQLVSFRSADEVQRRIAAAVAML